MRNFLDKDGLLYLWTKIKATFVQQETGKGLSTNDYTTAEKTKLSGIEAGANKTTVVNNLTSTSTTSVLSAAQGKELYDYFKSLSDDWMLNTDKITHAYTHSQSAHAPSNAQANVIESVLVNGSEVTISEKAVDITVPTKVSDLTNDSGYLTEHQDISGKADKATTLAGYGIGNAYTKTETDTKISTAKQEAIEAVLGGVTDDFDTLKEVADWIQSDTTNSTALINRVSAIENDYVKDTELVAITNAEIDTIIAA